MDITFWWVPLITVPLLALLLKAAFERMPGSPFLHPRVRRQVKAFPPSGNGYWLVSVTLRSGQRYAGVWIDSRFKPQAPEPLPFRPGDIVEVTWEGFQPEAKPCLPRSRP